MGWWGTGILEGDPALDVISRIENELEVTVYPLDGIAGSDNVRAALKNVEGGLAGLAKRVEDPEWPGMSQTVVACVAMAAGIELGTFKDVAVNAAMGDSWAKTSRERGEAVGELIMLLEHYQEASVIVPSNGVVSAMAHKSQVD